MEWLFPIKGDKSSKYLTPLLLTIFIIEKNFKKTLDFFKTILYNKNIKKIKTRRKAHVKRNDV